MQLSYLSVALALFLCVAAASDLDALLELKKGIKEDPSGRILDSWNLPPGGSQHQPGCPPDWHGVRCSGDRVSSVALDNMGLVGEVDFSAVAKMYSLSNFSLANNSLSGALSPELGSLSSLQFLDLSRNSFDGPLPGGLTAASALVYLNLSSNRFGGPLPPSGFDNLRKLEYLDLSDNAFSGRLDDILGQLQSVIYVDLSRNQLTGSIESISDTSAITSSLQHLNVSRNRLSGDLFLKDPMPLFDSLEVFDASFNRLAGSIPSFNFIVSLQVLRIGNNQFSGSLPEALFKEGSMVLTELDLSCNRLTGPVKSIISTTLKNLNLSSNKLTGPLPPRIGSCAVVDFSNNMLSGDLSAVQNWGNYVQAIDLSSNKLTGSLPNETSQFLRLISFRVSNNLLAGELPSVIGTYPEINTIDLSLNQLSGPLPPSLFTSPRLTNLNLSGNNFAGRIPFSKSATLMSSGAPSLPDQFPSLVSLDLSNNSLNGALPQVIGIMTGLRLLNIARNNISGQIPKEIGLLHKLLYMDLSNNHFKGSIPEELPDSLVELNVSYNGLSGIVPKNLLKFPDSAFHPGNTLLVFPIASISDVPSSMGNRKHGHHMKNAIKYIVVICVVICVVLILLSVFIYHKVSHRRKDTDQQQIRTTHLFRLRKAKPPPNSTSFSQDHLLQSRSSSMPLASGAISSASKEPKDSNIQEVSPKDMQFNQATMGSSPPNNNRGTSSMSLIISSPPVSDPCFSENPSILNVGSPDRLAGDLHLFDNSLSFTAEQLSRAPAEIIGRSCHGSSYKATLDSGNVLTVKWLREGIVKSKKEFSREAKKLGTIRHPNIVSLRGYYWGPKEHERLILSNYINAASLTAHLCEFETRNLQPLSLSQRLSIAVDVASSLNYLHNERAMPHGNLKSTNILLQMPELSALLTDYSLHRILTPVGMADQVLNAGALGYRPPEFASTNKPCPSLKSDIYAFGVVLLEILTGKSAGEIVSGNPGIVDLTDWVRLLASENRSHECFDRLILDDVSSSKGTSEVLESILGIALRCIRSAPERPEIKTVFEDLSSICS